MPLNTSESGREASNEASTALSWLSNHSSEIVSSLAPAAAIVGLLLAMRALGIWLCRPGRRGTWITLLGQVLAGTRLWFMIGAAARIVSGFGQAPAGIATLCQTCFVIVAGLQVAIWLRRLLLGIAENRASADDGDENLQSAMGLIRVLVTASLFILAVIVILANLGINVTGLLAGLGIGGIAIGLAAQGIFSDLFAALSILFDKPFRKGDLVRWDTSTGTVDYIGLKSTRIRALSGEEIIVSNANLLGKELRNFARLERRRINQPLCLVFHTPLEHAQMLGALLQPVIDACEGCHFQRCGLETFGPSSLDFMLVYDIDASDQSDTLARRNAVNLAILGLFAERSIHFAYPTQTTFSAAPDGSLVMPWAPSYQSSTPAKKR